LAHEWCHDNHILHYLYAPDWSQGRKAGPLRNERMAQNADALIAIWDGKSPGTRDMIARAHKHGLKVYVKTVEPEREAQKEDA